MKLLFVIILLTGAGFACSKKDRSPYHGHPSMRYTDLRDAEVKLNQPFLLDINADGIRDFSFSTLLVGDPVLERDRLQFYASSGIHTSLLNDASDESPVLHKGELISSIHTGYLWWELSSIVLAEKITSTYGSVHWEGRWMNAFHRYLPVRVNKSGETYFGWVEISMDTTQGKLILHRSAIGMEAGKPVRAGY